MCHTFKLAHVPPPSQVPSFRINLFSRINFSLYTLDGAKKINLTLNFSSLFHFSKAIITVPFAFWWVLKTNTRQMEPFAFTIITITTNHLTKRYLVTVTISRFISRFLLRCYGVLFTTTSSTTATASTAATYTVTTTTTTTIIITTITTSSSSDTSATIAISIITFILHIIITG
ncbi:conserved hypothetical protein [Lodderomyces elongisporus NRRL YB-4239]|uniref:Uncharacterized protein n=1 Tax=Lodderomyces elongisporus (strain ATCC 11503 / CBS 2605 / JCM 1781 / NBRC 1676 / NRRL YB-4239) TaxID=379508 RepID=A5DYD6_LODEL|nr:conserved hypothetical protein [Lodderomyces elongisporus NRRL YB-4239]